MRKIFNKFISLLIIFALILSDLSPLAVYASENTPAKGDLGYNGTSNKVTVSRDKNSVEVLAGSFENEGDVQVKKVVTKTETEGKYNVEFFARGKDISTVVEFSTPIYFAIVFDRSGSMICDGKNKAYATTENRYWVSDGFMSGHWEYRPDSTSYTAADGTKVYCYMSGNNSFDASYILKDKWESAVNGAVDFSKELVNMGDETYISLVTFAANASSATNFSHSALTAANFNHPQGSTNLEEAIRTAKSKLDTVTTENAKKYILVIGDGAPTVTSSSNNDYATRDAKKAATIAKQAGIEIYAIGYGIENDTDAQNVLKYVSSNTTVTATNPTGNEEGTYANNNYYYQANASNIKNALSLIGQSAGEALKAGNNAVLEDGIGSSFTLSSGTNELTLGTITESWTSMGSFEIDIDQDVETNWYPTNDGFKLSYYSNKTNQTEEISSNDNPEVYWVQNKYDYTIKYLYENLAGNYVEDESLRETGKAVKNATISVSNDTINDTNHLKTGYAYSTTTPSNSITISNTETNVIEVKYSLNSYDYTIKHVEKGNESNILDTESNSAKYGDTITVSQKSFTGFKYDHKDKDSIVINTENNTATVYYTRNNYAYTINHIEEGTNKVLDTEGESNKPFGTTINVNEKNIPGFTYVSKDKESFTITDGTNEATVTYKRNNYPYEIRYVEQGNESNVLKSVPGTAAFESHIEVPEESFTGYRYVTQTAEEVVIGTGSNIVTVYYTRNNYSYTINHIEKGTNNVLETTGESAAFGATIPVEQKTFTGFKYDSQDKENIVIDTENNVANVYYTRNNYGYTIKHVELNNETNVLGTSEGEAAYGATINVSAGTFAGFTYVSKNKDSIVIDTENNTATIYYTRNNYGYTINHIEKDTDNILDTENESNIPFGTTITVSEKEITGFTYESQDKNTIVIDTDNNVANVYYTRNNYDYTINHIEKGTNNILDTESDSAAFADTITVSQKTLTGFKYDSQDKNTIVIDTDNNVANVYYTRNNYEYTIYHVELNNETNVLGTTEGKAAFADTIPVSQQVFSGFTYASQDKENIVINTENNVAYVYYTRGEYNYVIKHVEKGNVSNILDTDAGTADYEDVIPVTQKNITGFKYDSKDKNSIVIDTENNIATVYYTRNNYDYTINHIEKGTNNVLDNESDSAAFGDTITVSQKTFTGFKYDSQDKNEIVIDTDNNVANVYYTRNNYGYTINHIEKGTNNVLGTESDSAAFGDTITVSDRNIIGFTYNSKDKETIVIDTENNVANVYYTRNNYDYTIKHVEKNKDNLLDIESDSAAFADVISVTQKNITGFIYDSKDKETIVIDTENNIAYVYYTRNNYGYTINHIEKGTNNILDTESDSAAYEETITVSQKTFTGFAYDSQDKNEIVIDTDNNVANVYYTRNNYGYTINHIEKNTTNILGTSEGTAAYEDEIEVTAGEFTGFTYDSQDKEVIIIDTDNNVANVYYTRNNYGYTITHIEKGTNNVLEVEESEALYEDEIEVNAKDFTGFTYDSQDKEVIVIDTENNTATVYYTRNNYDYIIKHVEKGNETNILGTSEASAAYEEEIEVTAEEFTGFTYDSQDKEVIVIDTENNEATVYYTRNSYDYTITHIEKGTNNVLEVEESEALYEDEIEVNAKEFEGFTYDSQDKEVIVINTRINEAIVYYTRNNYDYIIKHVEKGNETNILDTEEGNVSYNEVVPVNAKEFEGFTYDSQDKTNITIKPENNEAIVYYTRNNYDYVIKHIDIDTNEVIDEEEGNAPYDTEIPVTPKDIKDYTVVKQTAEVITVAVENNEVIVYYALNKNSVTVRYFVLDFDTSEYIPFSVVGKDSLGNNNPGFEGFNLDDQTITTKIGYTYNINGQRPLEYTFVGLYEGENMETLISDTNEDYSASMTDISKVYTYVYMPPVGGPPQTGGDLETHNYIPYAIVTLITSVLTGLYCLIRKEEE